jgi:arginine-tRNA-protein transferase
MKVVGKFLSSPDKCGYLPDRQWRLEYEYVSELTPAEYMERVRAGWRKYGHALFRPVCGNCTECQPIRIVVDKFNPSRSQRRAFKANQDVKIKIGEASLNRQTLDLYVKHHEHHADAIGWPQPDIRNSLSHLNSLSDNPFPIEEWCHYLDDELIGIAYVDPLPDGFSAVYSFYTPELLKRSLGTWMILAIVERAKQMGLPYVYLGYYVKDCRSMKYKAKFLPHEIRGMDGVWREITSCDDAE